MALPQDRYYRRDLALIHHRGFGFHAQACAPGIVALLEPVLSRGGLVLELGCAARVPAPLAAEGVQVTVASAFGTEQLPTGLRVLIGRRVP